MRQSLNSNLTTWRFTLDASPEVSESLTQAERRYVQRIIPGLCARGGWRLRCCAAGPHHVRVIADVDPSRSGDTVRRQIERWLTQALNQRFDRRKWWTDQGLTEELSDEEVLNDAYPAILSERA